MKMVYKVSQKFTFKCSTEKLWNLITSPECLELYHPFCKENKVLLWESAENKKDYIIYLNGLKYYREFFRWEEKKYFELFIGKLNGKKSKVKWKIMHSTKKDHTILEIEVFPYKTSKIPKFIIYSLVFAIYIKPMLKKYLRSVLRGINWYLNNKSPVPKSHFGNHSWFQ